MTIFRHSKVSPKWCFLGGAFISQAFTPIYLVASSMAYAGAIGPAHPFLVSGDHSGDLVDNASIYALKSPNVPGGYLESPECALRPEAERGFGSDA